MTFGLIAGVAGSTIDAPILSCIGVYFIRHRFLANGIAFAGSSISGFVMPPLLTWATAEYGVRGCLMILAGTWVQVLIVAAIIRPLSRQDRQLVEMAVDAEAEVAHPGIKSSQRHGPDGGDVDIDCVPMENCTDDGHSSRAANGDIGEAEEGAMLKSNTDYADGKHASLAVSVSSIKQTQKENGCLLIARDYWNFMRSPGLAALCLTFTIACIAYYAQFFILPPFIEEAGFNKTFTSIILSIFSIVELIVRIIVCVLSDKFPDKKRLLLGVGFSVSAVAGFIMSFLPYKTLMICYAVAVGACGGVFIPLMVPMLMECSPADKMGSAAGLFSFIAGLGATAGPPLVSMLKETTGTYGSGMIALACCYVLAFLVLLISASYKKICGR